MSNSAVKADIFPPPPGETTAPVWNGNGFVLDGGRRLQVLSYEQGDSGWSDDLTTFHEETAGDSHFIDEASRSRAVDQIRKFCEVKSPTILDIGCSSGFLIKKLRNAFPDAFVVGTDVVPGPLQSLSRSNPDVPLLHFDLTNCPLPDESVDAVVLLNVLEHIEDDYAAVAQLSRILKPGGIAVIEVPAGPGLFDIYDELLMHFRRYEIKGLSKLFTSEGFEILNRSHMGFMIYPGFYAVKKWRRLRRKKLNKEQIEEMVGSSIKNTSSSPLLKTLMSLELQLGEYIPYPTGIRCLLTCRKKS